MEDATKRPGHTLLLALLLVAAISLVYGQVVHFAFLGYDDDDYVSNNPHVRAGLTSAGLSWAFTTGYAANWHPLTWLSHMADAEVYGLRPGGHHLTNLLLHILNTLLLLWLLIRLTQNNGRALLVAGLFALHPLHVQSVAWVAERKDVLSTFFGLLSILAYVGYAGKKSLDRYLLALLLMALSLMAKPMLVTLPFLYLLLDYWPLRRLGDPPSTAELPHRSRESVTRLLAEKIPFLVLSAASSVITVLVQKSSGAVETTSKIPIPFRLSHAIVSYVWYIWKMIWPSGLSVHYPHPLLAGNMWRLWQVGGAVILLLAITAFAIREIRRRPYFAVGWFWYLGMLVPVIGLVQVGSQGMADRYTYLPLVGIFCIIAWGSADLFGRFVDRPPQVRALGTIVAVVILGAYGATAWNQTRHWKDSVTLYTNALGVTPNDPVMRNNLGNEFQAKGKLDEAAEQYRMALRLDPASARTQTNLGNVLSDQGKQTEAIEHYTEALRLQPNYAPGHNNLGLTLQALSRFDEAKAEYKEAVRLDPSYTRAHVNLGNLLMMMGQAQEALIQYDKALELDPDLPDVHFSVGCAYQALGNAEGAMQQYSETIRLRPDHWTAHANLGSILAQLGRAEDATMHFDAAMELTRNDAKGLNYVGQALMRVGRPEAAVRALEEASRLDPEWIDPIKSLALLYASAPDPRLNDADKAILLAERAAALSEHRDPNVLQLLAAVYAGKGRLDDAVRTAEMAIQLANETGATALADQLRQQLAVYRDAKSR